MQTGYLPKQTLMTQGGDGFQLRRRVGPAPGNTSLVGWLPKAAAVELPERGKRRGMGRLGELAVGLVQGRVSGSGHIAAGGIPLVFGLCYGILMFGISYFGVVNSRNEHHFVASLVEAAILGALSACSCSAGRGGCNARLINRATSPDEILVRPHQQER